MDQQRAAAAIHAFSAAEAALRQITADADGLVNAAESVREADESVRALAKALGKSGKKWGDVADRVLTATAEVEAAAKLLQKAEPQELMDAIEETTTSVGELRTAVKAVETHIDDVTSQQALLEKASSTLSNSVQDLRDALTAKVDLAVSNSEQSLRAGERAEKAVEALGTQLDSTSQVTQERIVDLETAQTQEFQELNENVERFGKLTMYAASAAAVLALAAAVAAVMGM